MQITRDKLQEIVREAAIDAGVNTNDYEAIFSALDKTKGVSFLTYQAQYGCPLTQAFGGDPDDGPKAARYVEELDTFKTIFDEMMADHFDVQTGLGFFYNVDVVG